MSPVKHRKEERPQHCLRSSFLEKEPRAVRAEKGFALLRRDIRALLPGAAAILAYAAVTHILFDRFCPMLILTGLPCPGCGMTRALFLVLTGRFAEAWAFQPPVYGWILLGLAFAQRRYLSGRNWSDAEKKGWLAALGLLLAGSLILYGIRIFTGFPEGIAEPGRTLWETVISACRTFQ